MLHLGALVLPFSAPTAAWFEERFPAPTEVQRRGFELIAGGAHALLAAPTGSGKTLAAFLWAIDRLIQRPGEGPPGARVVYVSPLKALAHDVERNLRAPLEGVLRHCARAGIAARPVRVDVRTGDTPARERVRQARAPGEILVTTPESLYLVLGSAAGENLRGVETVIVDEIHALAPTKRGAHLALSLERLCERAARDPQRIGLSATARPLEEVARFLGGERPVAIVDASARPALDLEVVVPVPDLTRVPPPRGEDGEPARTLPGTLFAYQVGAPTSERGVWPVLYVELVAAVRAHRSTIVFVNSRGLCERLVQRMNALAGEELVAAHHGSVSRERRSALEESLKAGSVRGIVATSSLELGIDMGAVDLVVQVESPGSVARGLQRVGRAGHAVGETSVGRIVPKFRGDLLEATVVAERMLRGEIETLRVPTNALDVLAQQLVACCCERPRSVEELHALARRAFPYRGLSRGALEAVLEMLSGRFPSEEFAALRPRLRWDRSSGTLGARRGAELVARRNAGTIPDRGAFGVHAGAGGPRVGELDEEMVYETRPGDTFLLGSTTWRAEAILRDRVVVSPAPGEPGRLPFWKGDGPGRPVELGLAIGAFVRELASVPRERAEAWLSERAPLSPHAASNLADYLAEQRAATGTLPSDRALVIERFRDELGDWRVCILSPLGGRVHAPWALAIQQLLADRAGARAEVVYTDDGIVLRCDDAAEPPDVELLLPPPEAVRELVTQRVGSSALFSGLFRENAVRALLVARRRPEERNPLWAQRLKARALLDAVQRFRDFPIVLETYRQALSDVFDLPALEALLAAVRSRAVAVVQVETRTPSPFAQSLVHAWVAAYLYEGDRPAAESRAQALTLDRALLRELIGPVELRELIDASALAEVEDELARRAPQRRARDRDELGDLLRRAGDHSTRELAERCDGDAAAWLAELAREGRALELDLGGEPRWIAAEDAGLYRSALGARLPVGLPEADIAPVAGALERLVRRFARGRGPFHARDLAQRYALPIDLALQALRALEVEGALVLAEIRTGGGEPEWCDVDVLRAVKRRTLARLRGQAAAVDGATFARFLPRWHGIGAAHGGPERLLEVVRTLAGLALPWSALAHEILPARIAGFSLDQLELACAGGAIYWIGRGALGPRDGRVALLTPARASELAELDPAWEPPSALHASILSELGARGACFLVEIERALRAAHPQASTAELEHALWDLVWAGRVSNDTIQPLRALAHIGRPVRGRGAWRSSLAGGRWWRTDRALSPSVDPTARAHARASALLERYGVVARSAASAEEHRGGFAPVLAVLRAMEDAGQVRRGWFVEGLGGAQFALPGALERLRQVGSEAGGAAAAVALPATDPASVWGALLPWPESAGAADVRPRRVAGAWVGLLDGRLAWYLLPGRRQVLVHAEAWRGDRDRAAQVLGLLCALPRSGRRRMAIERIDGVEARGSPHLALFLEAGFCFDYRALIPDPSRKPGALPGVAKN